MAGRWLVQGGIVLQEGQVYCNRGSLATEEIVLQYSLVGSMFVLQYKLYCELRVGLCRDTARAGVGRAQLGTGRGARGAGAHGALGRAGRRARANAQAAGERAPGRSRRLAGARQGPAGHGRGRDRACCWASRLCTRCTQPVLTRFDSVLFVSQFLDIVHELGS